MLENKQVMDFLSKLIRKKKKNPAARTMCTIHFLHLIALPRTPVTPSIRDNVSKHLRANFDYTRPT